MTDHIMLSGCILPNKPLCRFITHAYSPHEFLHEAYLNTITISRNDLQNM